ncbi:MAG TPA: prephenate dehydrogenase/arogenate dehydrogenase family protein [Verrucomicrobiae bacterium]|nr:prephenate dehydrogenase/arogenate dehydrogenase family protein [Verrucomicrobiae bacterium]
MHWNRITLVGVGLLGGSLGLALQERRVAASVVGYVRRAASIKECRARGAVTLATRDLAQAVSEAQLIILCTPIAQMRPLLEQMLPALTPGVIITDVGSVKASVLAELEPLAARAEAHFIGSHPMAGAEKTGVAAARADLFADAICVITPTPRSNRAALRNVEQFWKTIGARVLRLPAATHDEFVSRSSHLPHVLAAELASFVLHPDHPRAQAALCANGFRDTTRIASGSPEMWRDIALANRAHLLRALDAFGAELGRFRKLLAQGKAEPVRQFFAEAKQRRDRWARQAGLNSPE